LSRPGSGDDVLCRPSLSFHRLSATSSKSLPTATPTRSTRSWWRCMADLAGVNGVDE